MHDTVNLKCQDTDVLLHLLVECLHDQVDSSLSSEKCQ